MKTIQIVCFFIFLFSLCAMPINALDFPKEIYVPDEILVRFKPVAKRQEAKSVNNLSWKLNARDVDRFSTNNITRMKLSESADVLGAIKEAYKNPDVLYAEPNQYIYAAIVPNDTYWRLGSWSMKRIKMPEAWDINTGSNQITIAVVDTGIDYNNKDLSQNIWVNQREIPNNNIDDDGNGYIDDYRGWDFFNHDPDPIDDNQHGTLCTGIIGAVGNNNMLIAGICWNIKLMNIKVLDNTGCGGTIAEAISAFEYAIRNGAKIINCSWVFFNYSQAIKDAMDAGNKAGALFVCAAGNFGGDNDSKPLYPCSYNLTNIISVAASDTNDNLVSSESWSSCYGLKTVHLAAPGWSVLSTAPGVTEISRISGTSASAPHVSGVAGLIWSQNPNWTNLQVKQKILDSADKIPSLEGKVMTAGRLNAFKALQVPPIYTGPLIQYREAVTTPDGVRSVFFDKAIPQQGTFEGTIAILKKMAAEIKTKYLY